MKKLMIAAAIALTAAFAQAAAVTWTITNVYAGNSSAKASGTTPIGPSRSSVSRHLMPRMLSKLRFARWAA